MEKRERTENHAGRKKKRETNYGGRKDGNDGNIFRWHEFWD